MVEYPLDLLLPNNLIVNLYEFFLGLRDIEILNYTFNHLRQHNKYKLMLI